MVANHDAQRCHRSSKRDLRLVTLSPERTTMQRLLLTTLILAATLASPVYADSRTDTLHDFGILFGLYLGAEHNLNGCAAKYPAAASKIEASKQAFVKRNAADWRMLQTKLDNYLVNEPDALKEIKQRMPQMAKQGFDKADFDQQACLKVADTLGSSKQLDPAVKAPESYQRISKLK